ncbi:hypothetical protein ACFLTS_05415 [Chloroflexota bacterium]
MRRLLSWLKGLGWKWRLLIAALLVIFIVIVVVPSAIYCSRERAPSLYTDISELAATTYFVNYDSDDGVVNECNYTLKVLESGVQKDSESCFLTAALFEPYPKRKVNAIIVGSTLVTLAEEEIWRSIDDLRIVSKEVMQIDLPIVNTARSEITYSGYEGYPGWPYHLNDSWTYDTFYDTDVPMQSDWTNTFRAEVVADDAIVMIEGVKYECFKVVHTMTDTTNRLSPGHGVGATTIEYWYKDARCIGPLLMEDYFNFRGWEIKLVTGELPAVITADGQFINN